MIAPRFQVSVRACGPLSSPAAQGEVRRSREFLVCLGSTKAGRQAGRQTPGRGRGGESGWESLATTPSMVLYIGYIGNYDTRNLSLPSRPFHSLDCSSLSTNPPPVLHFFLRASRSMNTFHSPSPSRHHTWRHGTSRHPHQNFASSKGSAGGVEGEHRTLRGGVVEDNRF